MNSKFTLLVMGKPAPSLSILQSRRNACSHWSLTSLQPFQLLSHSKRSTMQYCRWDATQTTLFLPAVFALMKSIITAQASTGNWRISGVNASIWGAWVVYHSLEKWDSEPTVITSLQMATSLFCSRPTWVFPLTALLASIPAQVKTTPILLAEQPLALSTPCKSFPRPMAHSMSKPFSQQRAPSTCNSPISFKVWSPSMLRLQPTLTLRQALPMPCSKLRGIISFRSSSHSMEARLFSAEEYK